MKKELDQDILAAAKEVSNELRKNNRATQLIELREKVQKPHSDLFEAIDSFGGTFDLLTVYVGRNSIDVKLPTDVDKLNSSVSCTVAREKPAMNATLYYLIGARGMDFVLLSAQVNFAGKEKPQRPTEWTEVFTFPSNTTPSNWDETVHSTKKWMIGQLAGMREFAQAQS